MSSITFDYNTHIFGSVARVFTGSYEAAIHGVKGYMARRAAERRLAALDDRLLADIGVNRCDIHDMVWNGKAL